jgi:hypothetical protein
MGQFSSYSTFENITSIFEMAGLPWRVGSYQRTTVIFNRQAINGNLTEPLPASYSQKALFLKNVDRSATLYHSGENSVLESYVLPPEKIEKIDEVAVVWSSLGEGKLGYLGDVNAEKGSTIVILAMCGISVAEG